MSQTQAREAIAGYSCAMDLILLFCLFGKLVVEVQEFQIIQICYFLYFKMLNPFSPSERETDHAVLPQFRQKTDFKEIYFNMKLVPLICQTIWQDLKFKDNRILVLSFRGLPSHCGDRWATKSSMQWARLPTLS